MTIIASESGFGEPQEATRTEKVFGVLLAVVIGIALSAITFHGLSGGFR